MTILRIPVGVWAIILTVALSLTNAEAHRVNLVQKDGSGLPIYLPTEASPITLGVAKDLARILEGMTGVPFPVKHGPGEGKGIFLGTASTYPEILPEPEAGASPSAQERYRLLTKDGSLWIVGSSGFATQNGVYGLIHALGYRQYFPTASWEIIPKLPQVSVEWDQVEEPAFITRSFFQTNRKPAREDFQNWERRNRARSNFQLNTVGLLRPSGAAMMTHPEWFTKEDKGGGHKPMVDNEALRDLVREDALKGARKDPPPDTLGLSPTDGGGWPANSRLGTPSDQMVTLANHILEGLAAENLPTRLAFLAYHEQAAPPSIKLRPGAIVLIATSFIRGGDYTPMTLLKAWKKMGAEVGVYEYLDNWKLQWNLPGASPAADLNYVQESIREFYAAGARYWISEAGSGWAPNGLGYYLAAQTLWDPKLAPTPEALKEEFLTNCFGAAKEPMKKFYDLLDGGAKPLLSEDLIARMYESLQDALKLVSAPADRQRILQLAAYTRFVELIYQYRSEEGERKTKAYEQLEELTFGAREMPMFDYHVVTRRPELSPRYAAEQRALWTGKAPADLVFTPLLSEAQLEKFVQDGCAANEKLTFEPIKFSEDLTPYVSEATSEDEVKNFRVSRSQTLLWMAQDPEAILELTVSGGWRAIGQKLPVKIQIVPKDDPLAAAGEELNAIVDQAEVPADGKRHRVVLKAKNAGLYELVVDDGFNETELEWPPGERIVAPSGTDASVYLRSKYSGIFFVPAGCDRIAGYSETNRGQIENDQGEKIFDFRDLTAPDYFDVAIAPSELPRIFRMEGVVGKKLLMTTPPYLARRASELLVPREVLRKAAESKPASE